MEPVLHPVVGMGDLGGAFALLGLLGHGAPST